jgi:hypothetical protein
MGWDDKRPEVGCKSLKTTDSFKGGMKQSVLSRQVGGPSESGQSRLVSSEMRSMYRSFQFRVALKTIGYRI